MNSALQLMYNEILDNVTQSVKTRKNNPRRQWIRIKSFHKKIT